MSKKLRTSQSIGESGKRILPPINRKSMGRSEENGKAGKLSGVLSTSSDEVGGMYLRRKTYVVLEPIVCKGPSVEDLRSDSNQSLDSRKRMKTRKAVSKDLKTLDELFKNLRLSYMAEFQLLSSNSSNQWTY